MKNIEEHYIKNADSVKQREGVLNGAFTQTVRGKLTRFAYKHLSNWEDAEDAVQETYLKAVAHKPSLEGVGLDNWMFVVLLNVLNRIKRKQMSEPTHIEADDTIGVDEYLISPSNVELDFENSKYGAQFERIFDGCSVRDAGVLKLHHLYGHTMSVVSQLLDLPLTTVQNIIHRNKGILDEFKAERA